MKKYFAWAAVFIGLYLVFVLRLVPISQVANRLPPDVYLSSATGSIWHGSAEQLIVNGQRVDEVKWSLQGLSLFMFDPAFNIEMGNNFSAGPRGELDISGMVGALTVSNANLKIDANQVARKLPLMIDVKASGELNLLVDYAKVGEPVCSEITGQLSWPAASVTAFEQAIPLGDLSAALSCEKGNLIVDVVKDNNLGLELRLTVSKGYKVKGQGFIKPTAEFPKALEPALEFLSSPDSRGRYKISF